MTLDYLAIYPLPDGPLTLFPLITTLASLQNLPEAAVA